MSKTIIGLIFILVGLTYGSLIIDNFYKNTLGYLVENDWIKLPKNSTQNNPERKITILMYSISLIIIGAYILWNQNK